MKQSQEAHEAAPAVPEGTLGAPHPSNTHRLQKTDTVVVVFSSQHLPNLTPMFAVFIPLHYFLPLLSSIWDPLFLPRKHPLEFLLRWIFYC